MPASRRTLRRLVAIALLAVAMHACSLPAVVAAPPQPPIAPRAAHARVVLISLDGFYPDIYRQASELGLQVPNLERLASEGVSADALVGIFPSSTYPSHATLITGVRSARHGITANTVFAPGKREAGGWYWFADSLRVPTLPQAAHAAGLVVAVAGWPSLVGAGYVDWQLPEIWSLGPSDTTSREKCRRWATPGLLEEVERKYGAWTDDRFEWGKQDDRITDGAVALLELKRPDLLLVHLVEVDHVLHGEGRNAPGALRAFENADRQIGRILQALAQTGLADSTNVVVVGDHGFCNVHTDVRPNVELARLQLLDAKGGGDWRAMARTNTAAAAIYVRVRDPRVRRIVQEQFERLERGPYAAVFEVLDRAALDRYGAFPGAAFGLACHPGYSFSGSAQGDFLTASQSRGNHGYLPEEPCVHAGFLAAGPAFVPGLRTPPLRSLDVAPTLAAVLGVDLGPQVEGIAVPGLLRRKD